MSDVHALPSRSTTPDDAHARTARLSRLLQQLDEVDRGLAPARLRKGERRESVQAWAERVGHPVIDPSAPPTAELLLSYRLAHGTARSVEREPAR